MVMIKGMNSLFWMVVLFFWLNFFMFFFSKNQVLIFLVASLNEVRSPCLLFLSPRPPPFPAPLLALSLCLSFSISNFSSRSLARSRARARFQSLPSPPPTPPPSVLPASSFSPHTGPKFGEHTLFTTFCVPSLPNYRPRTQVE
jgi:hypothetical protein